MSNDKLSALLANRFGEDYTGAVIANRDFSWFIHNDQSEHADSVLDEIRNNKIDLGKGATAFLEVDKIKYMLFRRNSEKLGISLVVYVDRGISPIIPSRFKCGSGCCCAGVYRYCSVFPVAFQAGV